MERLHGSSFQKKAFAFLSFLSFFKKFFNFFLFLGPYSRYMEVSRLGVELELQPPAYTTAAAMQDPRCICDLHHSTWQHQILNRLSEARDQPCVLMDASQICFC